MPSDELIEELQLTNSLLKEIIEALEYIGEVLERGQPDDHSDD